MIDSFSFLLYWKKSVWMYFRNFRTESVSRMIFVGWYLHPCNCSSTIEPFSVVGRRPSCRSYISFNVCSAPRLDVRGEDQLPGLISPSALVSVRTLVSCVIPWYFLVVARQVKIRGRLWGSLLLLDSWKETSLEGEVAMTTMGTGSTVTISSTQL